MVPNKLKVKILNNTKRKNIKKTNPKGLTQKSSGKVAIIMGSSSDFPVMKEAGSALQKLNCQFEFQVVSAHRTPEWMYEFAKTARSKGFQVIIAGAGQAAHLPGMVASLTELPVIGVPVPVGPLQGADALLSIVQMPKGVPVATVGIGNAYNAGLLAAKILAASSLQEDTAIFKNLNALTLKTKKNVLKKPLK